MTQASTTTAAVNYGQKYLAIITPYNNTLDAFKKAAGSLPANPTTAQMQAVVGPLVSATQTADRELLAVNWPGQTETDIRTLVTDDGAVYGDLTAIESGAGDVNQLSRDAATASSAAALVRTDLGLPSNLG